MSDRSGTFASVSAKAASYPAGPVTKNFVGWKSARIYRAALAAILSGGCPGLAVISLAKPSISKGRRTGTELLVIPGNPTSAAILSLANVSAGPPGSRSARLAAAASQSTRARDNCELFISSAGAALAMNRAMPTRRARFNPASFVLRASQDESYSRVKCIESRHTRVVSFGVGFPAPPSRAGEERTKNDSARSQFDSGLKRRSRTGNHGKRRRRATARDPCHHGLRPCA